MLRQLAHYIKEFIDKLIEWLSHNPEYAIMLFANLIIFFS